MIFFIKIYSRYLQKKMFTLIELIVVITIISILSLLAFIGLNNWLSKGRDSRRMHDLNVISRALDIKKINSKLPLPDNYISVKSGNFVVIYQGDFATGVFRKLGISKLPLDPLNSYYTYSVDKKLGKYQLVALLENEFHISTGIKDKFDRIYRYPYVVGDIVGVLFSGYNLIEKIENLTYIDFLNLTGEYTLIFDNQNFISNDIPLMWRELSKYNIWPTRCRYNYKKGDYFEQWDLISDLGYISGKCYVFGDEGGEAKAACKERIIKNTPSDEDWVWIPARWYITDGNGKSMKDKFYNREIKYKGHVYICRGFSVAKYEMSDGVTTTGTNARNGSRETISYSYNQGNSRGEPVSKAGFLVITDISSEQAFNSCKSKGTGYHLITNNEWMTIARNIEMQSKNWSSGSVGNGYIPNGRSDSISLGCIGDDDGTYAEPAGTSCVEQINGRSKNVLLLSNGESIYDLAGNVWEIVDRGNDPESASIGIGEGNSCGLTGRYSWYGTDNYNECNYQAWFSKSKYGPINNINSNNGIGNIYSVNGSNRVILRGSPAHYKFRSGIYSLYFRWEVISRYFTVGFRCSK